MNKILRYSLLAVLFIVCGVCNAAKVRTYKKATAIESGKAYLVAADVDGTLKVATVMTGKNYGYITVVDAKATDGAVELSDATNDYTITSTDGGYTIKMSDDRYLYQTGTYNSFNFDVAPTEGQVWTIEAQSDGTFKITNNSVSKYIQYSTKYSSYGSYADAQDGGLLPTLYVFDSEKEVTDDPTAKGAEANPYLVSEIQALTDDFPTAKVWVKGYIAGSVNTEKGSELTTGEPNATNIGLSESGQVTSVIPIQLPKGDVRTALNIVDNAGNIGKEVLVYGNIQKYCSVTGVKSVSAYKFTGNSTKIDTGIDTVKAEANADGPAYNVAGQKVADGFKGLVIKNGKKIIMK